ncbi:hypothetical protein [Bradyrhizobium brasilense]|uniref:Uncharacterized protein n=1 Tax=Bradyrhizobium brasilense TaxID=1419277 RepID=A0ABY8JHH7_9BRAD|nr:hypothetical protein [Bradyrhizobium brasilense]WFU64847.1 hypothetical protein QA636_04665 [Bradyrhizobium brasilense]
MSGETDSLKEALDRIAEAQRLEREAARAAIEAKRTLLFQLARELNYSVTPNKPNNMPWDDAQSSREAAPVPNFSTPVANVEPLAGTSLAIPNAALVAAEAGRALNAVLSKPQFDGTFASLIQCYRQHEKSPYHNLKNRVRINYDHTLNRIERDVGTDLVSTWNADRVQSLYDHNWAADGKTAMGHTVIAKLRLLCGFGSVVLNDDACTRLSAILGNMRFTIPTGRNGDVLTIDHVRAIRSTAHKLFNWPSIALAQAFLLEIPKLKQVDVLGEWVPMSEPGTSDVINGNEKWLHGLRWSDIDENFVLRRTITSGRKNQQKELNVRLTSRAMIMEEINRVPPEKRVGPMIVCELTLLPWAASEFRRKWRIVADKAGVPEGVTSTSGAYFVKSKSEVETDDIFG